MSAWSLVAGRGICGPPPGNACNAQLRGGKWGAGLVAAQVSNWRHAGAANVIGVRWVRSADSHDGFINAISKGPLSAGGLQCKVQLGGCLRPAARAAAASADASWPVTNADVQQVDELDQVAPTR